MGYVQAGIIVYLSLTPKQHQVLVAAGGDRVEHIFAFFMLIVWFGWLYTEQRTRSQQNEADGMEMGRRAGECSQHSGDCLVSRLRVGGNTLQMEKR